VTVDQPDTSVKVRKRTGGRRARTDVARAMILAAIVSLIVIGGFNVFHARQFLTQEAEDLLFDLGAARGTSIERSLDRLVSDLATHATDRTVGEAILELSMAYAETTETLTAEQRAELASFYADEASSVGLPGSSEVASEVSVPPSERTQYLQYWYLAANPNEDRAALVDPGDGSAYSSAHSIIHPSIVGIVEPTPVQDFLLIDEDGEVVYSTDKRIDFSTNALTGAFAESSLGQAIRDLRASAAGQVRMVDFAPYAPAGGELEFWVVSLVRIDDEVVGAIAGSIPNAVLTEFTTGGGMWEEDGLGDTGEVYIVGPDMLLRSESRLWLEDPDAYLNALESAGYPPEVIDDIRTFGTTVLLQPVDTEPVQVGLSGEIFTGTTRSYLDRRTLSASGPLRPGNLGWIVVSEAERGQVTEGFVAYLVTLLIALVIIGVIVVIIAIVASNRLLKPIGRIGEASERVGEGDLDVELFDEGRDEFAYLSREFNHFVEELRHVESEARATQKETSDLLASVVPGRLVERIMAGGRGITEALNDATLVAVALHGEIEQTESVDDIAQQQSTLTAGVASLARDYGAEHLSSSASTVLYATGLAVEGRRIDAGVDFALAVDDWARALDDRGFALSLSIGISSGDIVTGVVGDERLAVDVLGAPRQIASDLAASARPGQILIDADTAARLDSRWKVERVEGLSDLAGAPLDGWSVERADADLGAGEA